MQPTPKKKNPYVNIRVYELSNNELIREHHRCNFGSDDTRRWLSKLVLWAVQNDKGVAIVRSRESGKTFTSITQTKRANGSMPEMRLPAAIR